MVTIDETSTSAISISGIAHKKNDFYWVYAVNLIYRCLVSGLWTAEGAAPYMASWLSYHGLEDNYSFCKKLSEYSPFINEDTNMKYWMEPLLCNTEFGQCFIEKFGLENLESDVYRPFIDALEKLFFEKEVPWEAGDLFNIKANIR